jgi:hypothetical protein
METNKKTHHSAAAAAAVAEYVVKLIKGSHILFGSCLITVSER